MQVGSALFFSMTRQGLYASDEIAAVATKRPAESSKALSLPIS
ncbi:hypothetical protein BURKHO8Y_50015 [Burkholderia sp. 8Y]|nr:hypothetical protein BURKHO8Y_50015 [Burkholderia sp. 8Y]